MEQFEPLDLSNHIPLDLTNKRESTLGYHNTGDLYPTICLNCGNNVTVQPTTCQLPIIYVDAEVDCLVTKIVHNGQLVSCMPDKNGMITPMII